MKKILTLGLGAALMAASASAAAADVNGTFFVNAGVGQAQYHVGRPDGLDYKVDDKDAAGALRLGYAWRAASDLDLGLEAGYVDLGKIVGSYHWSSEDGLFYHDIHADAGASGWLAGVNGKYRFANKWFVSARAGWFRSTVDATYDESAYHYSYHASGDVDGNGWYGGVGVGYTFAPNFSLGLNYDNYHAKAGTDIADIDDNVSLYTVSAEFRF